MRVPLALTGVQVPEELHYTADHEWVAASGQTVRVGITDYAQDALGDVVFVDLLAVGVEVAAGGVLGEVESTKSVSEVYAPVAGTIVSVNEALSTAPEQVNGDPYGSGWLCELAPADPDALQGLLDAAAYRRLVDS
ncbi:MAG: glycine cleavage system protein GcvH [Actinomycetota bacterium]|nr:glycine cleavage system protein GcvH [Actinomycetota bacterium]MDA8279698.1 glycine cleavage system protein GcvH [Actinomycetota bacterium]